MFFNVILCEDYHDLAIEKYKEEDYAKAYFYINKAVSLYDSLKLNNLALYAELKHDFAMIALFADSNTNTFVSNIEESINVKHQIGGDSDDYYWSIKCYANGLLYLSKYLEFPNNLNALKSAKTQYEKLPNHNILNKYSECLNDLAERYSEVDINKAIHYGLSCLALKRQNNDADTLSILSNLGDYYKENEMFDSAFFYLKQVLNLREATLPTNDESLVISHMRMASLFGRIKEYDSAFYHSEKAGEIEKYNYGEDTKRYATILLNSGTYKFLGGDIVNALKILKKTYYHPKCDKSNVAINLAGIYSQQGNEDSCYHYLKDSWQRTADEISKNIVGLSISDRFYYLSQQSIYYQLTFPINFSLRHVNHAGMRKLACSCVLYYKRLIMGIYNDSNGLIASESLVDTISQSLDSLSVAIETWSDFSGSWYNNDIPVFIIKPMEKFPIMVKLSMDSIAKTLRNETPTTPTHLPLYENIWKEILDSVHLIRGGRIYIACESVLSQISIEYIYNYDWEYIGDVYDIIRVTTISNIIKLDEKKVGNSIALYGGLKYDCNQYNLTDNNLTAEDRGNSSYLLWSKKEVEAIKSIMDSSKHMNNVFIYSDVDGTKESIKRLSNKSPSILHFATHGIYPPTPTVNMDWYDYYLYCLNNSGLLLSCNLDSNDDGILYAKDILHLNFSSTDLLVLSACNTGRGGLTPYGIAGIQTAFKVAGVNTIIMTLGKINDISTSIFMESFYRGLASGMTKRESFKHAQKTLRQNNFFGAPYYWTAFIMID